MIAPKGEAEAEENGTMTIELDIGNGQNQTEQAEDPYQNQQSTPVFVDKNDTFVGKLLDNEAAEVSAR